MIVQRLLLRLYPRVWRVRYEEEFLMALSLHPLSLVEGLDLIRGAIDAHWHPHLGMGDMSCQEKRHALSRALQRSLLVIFCMYVGFIVAGLGFQQLTERPIFVLAAQTHHLIGIPLALVVAGAILALLAFLLAGLPILATVLRYAFVTKRHDLFFLLAGPFLALGVVVGTIHIAAWLPERTGNILYFGSFWLAIIVGTIFICVAVARSRISHAVLRFAMLSSMLTVIAMTLMLVATILWGIGIQSEAPALFAGNTGIMRSSTIATWFGIIAVMVLATSIAIASLVRSFTTDAVFRTTQ